MVPCNIRVEHFQIYLWGQRHSSQSSLDLFVLSGLKLETIRTSHETIPKRMANALLLVWAVGVCICWVLINALLVPKAIVGIPYNKIAKYTPWGDLASLGVHNWRTGQVFDWLSKQCLTHQSPLVQLFIPSFSITRPTLVLADLNEIHSITTRRITEIDRADVMHTWFGLVAPQATIGLKSKNRAFKNGRRLWNVILGPKFLETVAARKFYDVAVEIGELWQLKAESTGSELPFEAQEDLRMATLDGIWRMNVGTDLGLLKARRNGAKDGARISTRTRVASFRTGKLPEFHAVLSTLLVCLDWVLQGISPNFYTWVFRSSGVLGRAAAQKDRILDECIAGARLRRSQSLESQEPVQQLWTCSLDAVLEKQELLASRQDANIEDITDGALRDELLELLITGHETTASSIAWALKYLTDDQNVQLRLRGALHQAFPFHDSRRLPTPTEVMNTSLPYLDAVIAETLRCSATGPVSFRQTLIPCRILGHDIPAGTPLLLVTAGPSYLVPEQWESDDAASNRSSRRGKHNDSPFTPLSTFTPEKWLVGGAFNSAAIPMLPFSAGSRGCFGKKIAMLELRMFLTVLIMRFHFPKLSSNLSRYAAYDGLTRRPTSCFVRPVLQAGMETAR